MPQAETSFDRLVATGANAVEVVVTGIEANVGSLSIDRGSSRTNTDADLTRVIALAHSKGMKVLLKPQLDFSDDPSHGRVHIGGAFASEAQWQAWFQAYGEWISHYAQLAQQNSVEIFSIGTELIGTTHREAEWRKLVTELRQKYAGHLTYASLPEGGELTKVAWWDAVDYIGTDVYYPLTAKNDPTVDEIKRAWVDRGWVAELENVTRRFAKPMLFTEIGYRSINGVNKAPGVFRTDGTVDLQEQADLYQAAFEVFWGKPWLAGMYWWQWSPFPNAGGPTDIDYYIQGKPAAQVLKSYYSRP